ncbi:basic proline-rich protein-like [Pteronotus mesoamericanus]|uniref:basic proline-rich protein-like n=1 Tax=Pteronotus mesoamericanus TaxID=1884717 RepID=UPI0023EA8CFB|nr:basic proline-rich protein-like [Pteronotus parnellii mesoamericanus]
MQTRKATSSSVCPDARIFPASARPRGRPRGRTAAPGTGLAPPPAQGPRRCSHQRHQIAIPNVRPGVAGHVPAPAEDPGPEDPSPPERGSTPSRVPAPRTATDGDRPQKAGRGDAGPPGLPSARLRGIRRLLPAGDPHPSLRARGEERWPAQLPPRRTEPGAGSPRGSPLPRRGSPRVSLPWRRVAVPLPSYLPPGTPPARRLAGPLRGYRPLPGPDVGLASRNACGGQTSPQSRLAFSPPHFLPPRPADTHPQSQWKDVPPWTGHHRDR